MKSGLTPAFLFIAMVLFLNAGFCEQGETPRALHEKVGDMEFRLRPENGVDLSVFGIPMIHYSYIAVITPGWGRHFYVSTRDLDISQNVRVESFQGGKRIIIDHDKSSEDSPFKGREIITLLPDNVYSLEIEFTFSGEEKALYEWRIGGVNAFPLMGRSCEASYDQMTLQKEIPLNAKHSDIRKSMVARDFKSLKIASLLGRIEITASSGSDVSFLDYRKNRWAVSGAPCFWLGILETELEKDKTYSHAVTIRFPKKPEAKKSDPVLLHAPIVSRDGAQIPLYDRSFIIPAPKRLESLEALFPLTSDTKIHLGKNPSPGMEKALSFFLNDLKNVYGIEPQITREEFPGGKTPVHLVVIGEIPPYQDLSNICDNFNLRIPDNKEGYSLFVHDDLACVASHSERGIFYGFTTLLQLVKLDENGLFLKGARIVDYPALEFRGVHCLSGKNAGDQISKALRDLLARFKMNSLVWECQYIIWDSQPDIAHPEFGMTKHDAQKVIRAADEYFIEIIPLVQSLGHCEWIFTNDKNLDLAEDPEKPYAYCPTNPDTYKFIFSVYREALDFFKPRMFHIGHDEVTMRGRFPFRSKPSGKTVTELIMDDVLKLHAWFTEKNVRVMLWGDMFLYAGEGSGACLAPTLEDAQKRRESLPRDVLVADWHYDAVEPAKYTSLKLFKDEGFEVVGCPWYIPDNIRNMARACVDYKAKGLLQTTWAGFNFKIDNHEESWFQYWVYLLAAHYAWTGENTPVEELPFRAQNVFRDLWMERKPVKEKRNGFMVDLRPACNIRLEDDEKRTGWLRYGPNFDLSSFPVGEILLDDAYFLVRKNEKGEAAISLSGKLNTGAAFPESVELKIDDINANEMRFLMTASFRAELSTRAGEIVIRYQDATSEKIDLVYGRSLFAFTDSSVGSGARVAWEGKTRNGEPIYLHELTWKNPHPEKKISGIMIKSFGSEAAPILFAITGIR